MSRRIRLAIIGLGNWARRAYLPNLALLPEVEVAALCTRSEANMRAALSLVTGTPRCFDSHLLLLEWGDFEGVIVATASEAHAPVVETCLRAGFPVLCEKPLAPTLEECNALVDTAAETHVVLQVGLEFRHAPVCVQAAQMIASGEIGKPCIIGCHVFRDKAKAVLTSPERYTKPGGVFSEVLCHYLDLVTWFAHDAPVAVDASAARSLSTSAFDHGVMQIEFAGGAVSPVVFSLFTPQHREEVSLYVIGETGILDLDLLTNNVTLCRGNATPQPVAIPTSDHPGKPYPGSYEQLVAFVECVRSGLPPQVDASVGRDLVALTLAADESAKQKRKMQLRLPR